MKIKALELVPFERRLAKPQGGFFDVPRKSRSCPCHVNEILIFLPNPGGILLILHPLLKNGIAPCEVYPTFGSSQPSVHNLTTTLEDGQVKDMMSRPL
jgi:hypothetical protein